MQSYQLLSSQCVGTHLYKASVFQNGNFIKHYSNVHLQDNQKPNNTFLLITLQYLL